VRAHITEAEKHHLVPNTPMSSNFILSNRYRYNEHASYPGKHAGLSFILDEPAVRHKTDGNSAGI
jgi:hypothetical protein